MKFINDVLESGNWQYPYRLVYSLVINDETVTKEIGLLATDAIQAQEMADMWLEIMEAEQISLTPISQED